MKSFLKLLKWCVIAIVVPIIVVVIGTTIYDRSASTSAVEYRVTNVGNLVYYPQGVADHLHLDFDGKKCKNVALVRLDIFNRSTKSLSDVPIQIILKNDSKSPASLLYKILLYPTDQDSQHFEWSGADNAKLNFMAKGLNASWSNEPGVSFNLYFDEGDVPELVFSTPKAGIVFTPYDDSKVFLFKYDSYIIHTIILVLLVILAAYGAYKIAEAGKTKRAMAFNWVFKTLYNKDVLAAKGAIRTFQAAAVAFNETCRLKWYSTYPDWTILTRAEKALAQLRESEAMRSAEATETESPVASAN